MADTGALPMGLGVNPPQTLSQSALAASPAVFEAPPLRVRLAQAILGLAECAEVDVANSIFVTGAISNGHLAALSGGKPKTVARLVEQFKIRGLIETRRQRLILRNPEKLQDIVTRFVSKEV
jgi:CRP-like cAMP-binding protein